MTTKQIYDLKQAAFTRHSERWRQIRLSAYPDTGGIGLYIHNWYACAKPSADLPQACIDLAGLVANSGEWASWHRIAARLDRWYDAAEHRDHVRHGFVPLWCRSCTPNA